MITIKKNISRLQEIITLISNINIEIDFVFCPEGIIVKAIDPSAISVAAFKIKKELFETYKVENERICTFQVDIISKILKKIGNKELTISFEEDKVRFESSKDRFALKFFVGNKDERPEPNIEGCSQWTVKTNEFFTIIKDFGVFNQVVKFDTTDDNLYIATKANIIEGKTLTNAKLIKTTDCYCWYSLINFLQIANLKKIFDSIKFEFGEDKPCMITAEDEDLKFKWILAPRIDER